MRRHTRSGFTLIELMLASIATAMILAAIYGLFSRAVKMRDRATEMSRDGRLRARAASVIRNDLRNAYVSGGTLGAALQGSPEGPESRYRGYLRLTTTTGRDTPDVRRGDVQQVEYFIGNDSSNTAARNAGMLMRVIDRNLLAPVREATREEQILSRTESIEVAFFDGQNWADSWDYTETDTSLPKAVRVRIQQVAVRDKDPQPAPLEILVPWPVQPAAEPEITASSFTPSAAPEATPPQQPGDEDNPPGEGEGDGPPDGPRSGDDGPPGPPPPDEEEENNR